MLKKLLTTFSILTLILVVLFMNLKGEPEIVSPLGTPVKGDSIASKIKRLVSSEISQKSKLQVMIENFLKDQDGRYAVYFKDLTTAETVSIDGDVKFRTASLYKLWVMAEAYNQIKNNRLKEEDSVGSTKGELYEKFDLELDEESKSEQIGTSVDQAIEQMVIISDNDSALLLVNKLSHDSIYEFLQNNGFSNSSFKNPPESTADDIGLFFDKLYRGEIVDPQYSDKMRNLLKRQRLNDRIPKYLPAEIAVAHKTGELEGVKHDAGIIFSEKPYILVVLSETTDPAKAAIVIANLSKEIYNFRSVAQAN